MNYYDAIFPFLAVLFFLFGISFGSFFNVCIYRIPLGMSVGGRSRSMCFKCKHGIAWYDDIPLLSYIILRGKCRNCKQHFSIRYFFVELLTGLLWLECFLTWGATPWGLLTALTYCVFISALIIITFIDIDHGIIPDIISVSGIPVFFIMTWIFIPQITWWNSLLGIIVGGGILMAVNIAYRLVTKRDGMGGGDVKLLAMIGAVVGWQGVLFTIFVSAIVGTVAGLILMLKNRKSLSLSMPYGPFLSLGAILYIFFGEMVFTWYISLLTF